jgi:hypothetical protein
MTQKELTDLLDNASRLYYNGQQSPLTDTEFDFLLKDLQKMERDNRYVYPNSPTKRVGSDIQDGFKKGTHPKPMFTIENAYGNDGVSEWIKKMIVSYDAIYFSVTPKYDGISCELHYKELQSRKELHDHSQRRKDQRNKEIRQGERHSQYSSCGSSGSEYREQGAGSEHCSAARGSDLGNKRFL